MRQRVNWGSSAQCKLIVGQHIQKVMRANIVAERKCWTVNHPYLHPVAELRRMHINVVKSKTNHGSQLRSMWRFYGGRKTGEPREKPSKHGRDQLQQLYSHEFQVF